MHRATAKNNASDLENMVICSEEQYIIYLVELDLPLNRHNSLVAVSCVCSSHFKMLKAPSSLHKNHLKQQQQKGS